jgi:hypothetical protein
VNFASIIRSFRNKIKDEHPNVLAKTIFLTERKYPLLLEDMMGAIRDFNETDFVKRPSIEFVNE